MPAPEELKTKAQLRADRRHALDAWLVAQGLRMDEAPFWSADQAAAERAQFDALDLVYEQAKSALRDGLVALDGPTRAAWFAGIGWTPQGATAEEQVDDYLARA